MHYPCPGVACSHYCCALPAHPRTTLAQTTRALEQLPRCTMPADKARAMGCACLLWEFGLLQVAGYTNITYNWQKQRTFYSVCVCVAMAGAMTLEPLVWRPSSGSFLFLLTPPWVLLGCPRMHSWLHNAVSRRHWWSCAWPWLPPAVCMTRDLALALRSAAATKIKGPRWPSLTPCALACLAAT